MKGSDVEKRARKQGRAAAARGSHKPKVAGSSPAPASMTDKQAAFVKEYIVDFNGAQAAIRAGYSKSGARQEAARLLTNADVQAALITEIQKRNERVETDQDYVVNKLHEIAEMDVLDIFNDDLSLRPLHEWPKIWRQYLSGVDIAEMFEGRGDDREMVGILKKIKWPDKVKNLELLGRHYGIFSDKLDVTSKGQQLQSGVLVVPVDVTEDEWESRGST